ncbi:hypothetical protein RKD20_005701 [Streptomyces sp. SLBN-8D4]
MINDEPDLLRLISEVLALGEDVVWSVDVADGMASLLVNLLLNHGQAIVHLPDLAVNRASAGYRGLGKTDARDAAPSAPEELRTSSDRHLSASDQARGHAGLLTGSTSDQSSVPRTASSTAAPTATAPATPADRISPWDERHDSTDHLDCAERSDPVLSHEPAEIRDRDEPIEPTDRALPIEPTERAEPTEPMDSTEPTEPIDSTESCDHRDSIESDEG